MRAAMHLARLHDATQYRLKRLLELYRASDKISNREKSVHLSYIAVELDNLNISALREFTISTIRRAKSVSGQRINVSVSLGPEEEIGAYILSVQNSVKFKNMKNPSSVARTDEPTIRDPKETEKILINCNASNLPSLQNALALNLSLFRDVKFFRHFYAHRSKDTFSKVVANAAKMGIYNPHHPDDVLLHVLPGSSQSVVEVWLNDAQTFYELLMH